MANRRPHLPLNLPHAATVADRIITVLSRTMRRKDPGPAAVFERAEALRELLAPCRFLETNLPGPEAHQLQRAAAKLGRQLVAEIAAHKLGNDRLGQCVRNLFECLGQEQAGAKLSLSAGENPASPLRPRVRRLPALDRRGHLPARAGDFAPESPETPAAAPAEHHGEPGAGAELGPPLEAADFPPDPGAEEELGPPLVDAGELTLPPGGGGRQTGGIIDDEDDNADWTFED